jgi:hypothetical protein
MSVTPQTSEDGLNAILNSGIDPMTSSPVITTGAYCSNLGETNQEIIQGIRHNIEDFGTFVVDRPDEPTFLPAVILGKYDKSRGIFIPISGGLGIKAEHIEFLGSIPTFETHTEAYAALEAGKQIPYLKAGKKGLKIRP